MVCNTIHGSDRDNRAVCAILVDGRDRLRYLYPGTRCLFRAGALSPTVTAVDPAAASNDLDTPIVITGTGFTAELSGTVVITQPTVYLGTPCGGCDLGQQHHCERHCAMGIGSWAYTLTVVNPDGGSGSLPESFTVTQGIGVWNAGELYGGNINKIVINPVTPTTLYAIAADVGLFRSQDGGESWSFKVASVYVEDLAIDPVSPNRVYRPGYSLIVVGGFYRSDDEGETWIPLTATFPITQTSGVDCWGGAIGCIPIPGQCMQLPVVEMAATAV